MSQLHTGNQGDSAPRNGVIVEVQKAQDAARVVPIVVVGPDTYDVVGLTAAEALAQWDERRIREIRRQIAAGTYLTDEKVNAAVDRLYEALMETVAERECVVA